MTIHCKEMLIKLLSTGYHHVFYTIYLLINVLIQGHLQAQPLFNGSRSATLSYSAVSMPGNQWPEVNPSSIATIKNTNLSLFVSEGYSLSEMRSSALNLCLPSQTLVYGLMVQSFGYDMFRDLRFTTTIGHEIKLGTSRKVLIGVSFTYNRITIQHIGNQNGIGLSFGLTTEIWPNLYLGASSRQPFSRNPTNALEEVTQLGIGYRLFEETWFILGIQKSISFQPAISAGIESPVGPGIVLRFRMNTQPYRIALGAEFLFNSLEVGILAEKHIILNWTPALSIGLPV